MTEVGAGIDCDFGRFWRCFWENNRGTALFPTSKHRDHAGDILHEAAHSLPSVLIRHLLRSSDRAH